MLYFFRILLLLVVSISLGFASLSYRTGGVAPRDFTGSAPVKTVEPWQTAHPDSLLALSQQAQSANAPEKAAALATQAFSKDITNGRAAAQLLQVYSKNNNHEDALKIARIADGLWPSHAFVRSRLADYWLTSGDIPKLISELDKLLKIDSSLEKRVFPILQQLVNNKDLFPLFRPYIEKPPEWWVPFFRFISKKNKDHTIVDVIYHERNKTKNLPDDTEGHIYMKRLIKDKRWPEAYFVWLGLLDEDQLKLNALLHDGGFEEKTFRSDIFGWQIRHDKKVRLKLRKTTGVQGEQALRISFNKKERVDFKHISQVVVLQPGKYQFSLRYKLNAFKTTKGLSWRVYCATGKKQLLVEGPAMRGRKPWGRLQMNFVVPADCHAQQVRLEASSAYIHDQLFQGALWFDDLSIIRVF